MKSKLIKGIAILFALCVALWMIGDSEEEADETVQQTAAQDGVNGSMDESQKEEPAARTDSRYQVGETVSMKSGDFGRFDLTLTECGNFYGSDISDVYLYVNYSVENTGTEDIDVGDFMFSAYADDYSVDDVYLLDGADLPDSAVLSGGRKLDGVLYFDVNPDNASVIELECGNVVFVLKDNTVQSDIAGNIVALENYINYSQTADEMAASLSAAGLPVQYMEEYGEIGSLDRSLTILNTDAGGCRIDISYSDSTLYSVCGINPGMSLQEANEILLSNGAVDATRPDDTVAWRYTIDGKYSLTMFGASENKIDISFHCYLDDLTSW